MITATLNITDVRRVAAALGVTAGRVLKAAGELGIVEHRINGQAFIDAADEDKLREHLDAKTTGGGG